MNHHLRFPSLSACPHLRTNAILSLTAALLTACASKPNPILTPPDPPKTDTPTPRLVQLNAFLFTTPDNHLPLVNEDRKPEIQVYSQNDGQALLKKLQRHRKCHLLGAPSLAMATRSGSSGKIELLKEFTYPTEYTPPKFPKDRPLDSTFPVTPATPSKFETRMLGLKATCKVHSSTNQSIDLGIQLNRDMFVGFVNYGTPITAQATGAFGRKVEVVMTENRIEMPVFDQKQALTRLKVNPGDYIVIRGLNPEQRDLSKVDFTPAPTPHTAGGPAHLVAFIQVTTPTE